MSTPTPPQLMGQLLEAFQLLELKANKDAHDAAVWKRRALSFQAKYNFRPNSVSVAKNNADEINYI